MEAADLLKGQYRAFRAAQESNDEPAIATSREDLQALLSLDPPLW